MEEYKVEEYRGYKINIYYDYVSDSPRKWYNLGTIYSNSRRYNPDGHSIKEIMNDEGTGLSKYFKENYIWLKIRGYEHSGLTISVSGGYPYNDPWDSGLFGIIAISKADAIKVCGKKICTKEVKQKAIKNLEAEVETLDHYYCGEVYRFTITDENDNEIDSCCGYYGDDSIEYIIEEGKSFIDAEIERRNKLHCQRIEKVKSNISSLVGNVFFLGLRFFRVATDKLFNMPVIEMAVQHGGRVRDEYYNTIPLEEVPEDVLENMCGLIKA